MRGVPPWKTPERLSSVGPATQEHRHCWRVESPLLYLSSNCKENLGDLPQEICYPSPGLHPGLCPPPGVSPWSPFSYSPQTPSVVPGPAAEAVVTL